MTRLLLFVICALGLTSCTEYYFDHALPVDGKDITKIPRKYHGVWLSPESDSINFVTVELGKDYFHRIVQSEETKAKSDLDSNTVILDGLLYVNDQGTLNGGYTFVDLGDSLRILTVQHDYTKLGKTTVLRKVEQGYLLNRVDADMKWWIVRYIDTREKDKLTIRSISGIDSMKFAAHQSLDNNSTTANYIKANWTTEDMEHFINRGGFSDTILKLHYKGRIPNRN